MEMLVYPKSQIQNNINLLKESEIANTDFVICCEAIKL